MENTLVAIVVVAVLTFATSVLSKASLNSLDQLGQTWKAMETVAGERARTSLTLVDASVDAAGEQVYLTVRNDGQSRLDTFAAMDLIVQYTSPGRAYQIVWLPYTTEEPASNQWTVTAVAPDVFEPGIVNPGETLTIKARLSPPMGVGTTNWLILTTSNGVSLSAYVVH